MPTYSFSKRCLSERRITLNNALKHPVGQWVTKIDPYCLGTAPGDPPWHRGELRDRDMDKCPDGNGEPSCDTAPPRRAVGDAYRLLVKLVR